MVTPAARREAVAHLRAVHGVSQRRACAVLAVDRSSVRYRPRAPEDLAVRARLRELAAERRRFGYRRLHWLIGREGIVMNHKKFRRLYREERLQVRRRSGCKRALGTRAPLALPDGSDQRWSLDFAADAFADGRRFRILVVVDDFTRECVALVADSSLSGARVARELDAAIARRSRPATIVSDNGTEFTSMAILKWCQASRIGWHCAGQAAAKCLRRELHRQAQGRVPERDRLHLARPGSCRARHLAARLQHRQAAFRPRLPDPGRLRRPGKPPTGCGACPTAGCLQRAISASNATRALLMTGGNKGPRSGEYADHELMGAILDEIVAL
jgi:putative transposase